jgi:hypothetical protein
MSLHKTGGGQVGKEHTHRLAGCVTEMIASLFNLGGYLARMLILTCVTCIAVSSSGATSIIVDVRTDRIIIIADSRAEESNSNGKATTRDDKCKILILGDKFVFTETGREGYTRETAIDPTPNFHGIDEAARSYNAVPGHDLNGVARNWAIQITNDFQLFYLAAPQRVRQLSSPGGTLLVGLFAGKDSGNTLRCYIARIVIDDSLSTREGVAIPVGYSVDEFPPRTASPGPHSTNGITQELLDGKTDRAKAVSELWKKKSRRIPRAARELRRLEFMIEQTESYDSKVHRPINAVQATLDSVAWVQNCTCQGPNH